MTSAGFKCFFRDEIPFETHYMGRNFKNMIIPKVSESVRLQELLPTARGSVS